MNEWNNVAGNRNPVLVATHHSSVSKQLREKAEHSIKQSTELSLDAIISTSTLELGIDIGDLDQVVQVGGLNSPSSFLQRVGRTGRREGKPQYFRGFCSDEEELVLLAACVNLGLKRVSENILFPKKAFHILAHQIICLCLQKLGTTADEIWNTIRDAYCFSGIERDEVDQLIQFMIKEDFLRIAGRDVLITSNKTEEEFLRMNWQRLFAIFETGPMYNVVDGKKIIGTLDSSFARNQKLPFVFVLGGQEWNTVKLDHELQQVRVEKNKTGVAPKWKALASHDIPFELAQDVGQLLMNDDQLNFLDSEAKKVLQRQRNIYRQIGWTKEKWILASEDAEGQLYLWTFCGDKINRATALLFEKYFGDEPEYDFRNIRLRRSKNKTLGKEEVLGWLSNLKQTNESQLENEMLAAIDVKWFSKFSQCLPDQLAKKTILEKAVDLQGLKRELDKVNIETDLTVLSKKAFQSLEK
jgi:ATP-dependent Lhr-like helicase